jgi:hypothetical protein
LIGGRSIDMSKPVSIPLVAQTLLGCRSLVSPMGPAPNPPTWDQPSKTHVPLAQVGDMPNLQPAELHGCQLDPCLGTALEPGTVVAINPANVFR